MVAEIKYVVVGEEFVGCGMSYVLATPVRISRVVVTEHTVLDHLIDASAVHFVLLVRGDRDERKLSTTDFGYQTRVGVIVDVDVVL